MTDQKSKDYAELTDLAAAQTIAIDLEKKAFDGYFSRPFQQMIYENQGSFDNNTRHYESQVDALRYAMEELNSKGRSECHRFRTTGNPYLAERILVRSDGAPAIQQMGISALRDQAEYFKYGYTSDEIIRITMKNDDYRILMSNQDAAIRLKRLESDRIQEERIRNSNPAVQDAWEAYQFVLKTCG